MRLDQATGVGLSERSMNTLEITRKRMLRNKALSDAQRLMAKAYRGVEYKDAHAGDKTADKTGGRTYRGIRYQH